MIQLPPDPIEESTPSSQTTVTPGKFNAELAKKVLLGLPNPDPSLLNAMKSDSKMTKEEISAVLQQSLATSMRDHPYLPETRRKELEEESKMEPLEWLNFVSTKSENQRDGQNERKPKS